MGKFFLLAAPAADQAAAAAIASIEAAGRDARESHPGHFRLTITEFSEACQAASRAFFRGHGTPSVAGISFNDSPAVVSTGMLLALGHECPLNGRERSYAEALARELAYVLKLATGAALAVTSAATLQQIVDHLNERRTARGLTPHPPQAAGKPLVACFDQNIEIHDASSPPAEPTPPPQPSASVAASP